MELSRRIRGINAGGTDGWDVYYQACDMIAAGVDVAMLTIGEHDIGTDHSILDAMHDAALAGHVGYSLGSGIAPLRDSVARRVAERTGVPTTPDNVLVVAGGQAGLFGTHHATCDAGDRALYIDPYYATYPGTIRAVGAEAVAVRARAERGFQPDPLDIAAVAEGAKTLLINSPNNPTGVVYGRDTLEGIAGVCHDYDLWLISDEVYDTQVWDGAHQSPRALPGMAERTLVIGSLSKSHAMTGSRIGWVVGPQEVIAALGDLVVNTTYGLPSYIQQAAVFALGLGEAFEAEVAAPFRRRRDLVMRLVEQSNVVQAIPSEGGMFVMLDLRATGLSGDAFAMRLLEERHVAVMPGESFGRAAAGHVRVALTVQDERLQAALTQLVALAETLAAERA